MIVNINPKSISRAPWVLTSNLDEMPSLFMDEHLPYTVDAYICNCQDAEIQSVISHEDCREEYKYTCQKCGNQSFYDANYMQSTMPWYESIQTLFTEDILLNLNSDLIIDDQSKSIILQIKMEIPSRYDFAKNQLQYQSKILYEAIISPFQKMVQTLHVDFNLNFPIDRDDYYLDDTQESSTETLINQCDLLVKYKQRLFQHIKACGLIVLPTFIERCRTLDDLAIFIAYPHLKDFEFVYWADISLLPSDKELTLIDALHFVSGYRNEKTYKKAIYQYFKNPIFSSCKFGYRFVMSISRHIKDVNIAKRMLKIDMYKHINDVDNEELDHYIEFLAKNYTAKQLEKLFIEYTTLEPYWFKDTVRMFATVDNTWENFQIVRCNVRSIHDEMIDVIDDFETIGYFSSFTFSYEEKFIKPCGEYDGFEIRLPNNGIELYKWGNTLHNCLRSYGEMVANRETTIYGFFENGSLKIAIEIWHDVIVQASAKYNQKLSQRNEDKVKGWFQSYFGKK